MCRAPRKNKKYVTRNLVWGYRPKFIDYVISYCNVYKRNGVVDYGVDC
jgi:hypothetical protein